jgi:hypothetical protein
MNWPRTSLTYFLWLPAGKDEFGFKDYRDAPLNSGAFYRHDLESPIAAHLATRAERLQDSANQLAGIAGMNELQAGDAPLGLRMVQFKFEYTSARRLPGTVADGPVPGTAAILSNGLYAWSFDIRYQPGVDPESLRDDLMAFLVKDFVANHIRRLFDFRWNGSEGYQALERYRGIVTYFQLDLLFNGLFDKAAHPHLSLGDAGSDQVVKRFGEAAHHILDGRARQVAVSRGLQSEVRAAVRHPERLFTSQRLWPQAAPHRL